MVVSTKMDVMPVPTGVNYGRHPGFSLPPEVYARGDGDDAWIPGQGPE